MVRGANAVDNSISNTNSNDEDSGAATGWSIANNSWYRTHGSTGSWTTFSQVRRIRVNGNEAQTLSPTDLSNIDVWGSTDGAVSFNRLNRASALAPAFDAGTTSYRTTVDNDVTWVWLRSDLAVSGSTVQIGRSGGALTAVPNPGHSNGGIELALDVGDNEFTLRVTAPDTSTKDYTVTVRRVPSGSEWWATFTPGEFSAGGFDFVGCVSKADCDSELTDNSITVGGETNNFARISKNSTNFLNVASTAAPNAQLQALKFCLGQTEISIGTLAGSFVEYADNVGWTAGVPVSLSIGTSCAPPPPVTLVSNLGQESVSDIGADAFQNVFAQGFTTGISGGGYTLTSVKVGVFQMTQAAVEQVRAELWSANPDGGPHSKLAELDVPSSISAGTNLLQAPAGTTLAPRTTYYVLYYTTGTHTFDLGVTESDDEDTGGAVGWSIADSNWYAAGSDPSTVTSWTLNYDADYDRSYVIQMSVHGTAQGEPTAPTPTNLAAQAGGGKVTLSWEINRLPGEPVRNRYNIEYGEHPDGPLTLAQTGAVFSTTPSYEIEGLTPGTTYRFRVQTAGTFGYDIGPSPWSDWVTATPVAPPAPPTGLTIAPGNRQLDLSWTPPAGTLTGYDVHYTASTTVAADMVGGSRVNPATGWKLVDRGTESDPPATAQTIPDLDNDTAYRVRVRAKDATGESVWVGAVGTPHFPAPTGLGVVPSSGQLVVSWTAPPVTLDGYDVHYKETAAADQVATTVGDPSTGWADASHTGTATTDTIGGLTNATAYVVRVRATDAVGHSAWAEVDGTPVASPSGSTDATLSALALGTAGISGSTNFTTETLSPGFSPGKYTYTAGVTSGREVAKITPTVNQSDATATVNGTAVVSGSPSDEIALAFGTNRITVRVTAQSGATQDYTLTVTRGLPAVKWSNSIQEGFGEGDRVRFSRLQPNSNDMSGTLTYAPGATNPASVDSDLGGGRSTTFTMNAGDQYVSSIDIPLEDDSLNEEHETFTVTINPGIGYVVGSPATITVTINDNDPPAAPGDLSLRARDGALRASWSRPDGPVTGYQARIKETSATDQPATNTNDPSSGWVTFSSDEDTIQTDSQGGRITVSGLTNGTSYDVQVRATDGQTETGNGWGPWSDAQSEMPMQSADADLSALTGSTSTDGSTFDGTLTLDQTFDAATTSYTATVANNVTHAKLTPTLSDSNASVEVGKGSTLETVASGTASNAIGLDVGANAVTVRVTAQDSTVQDYTVTITRRLSSDATLSDLTGTPCTDSSTCSGTLALDQTFDAATTGYTATVVNTVTHASLTPTVNHSAATVQVGKGATLSMVNSGTASNAIALDLGANAITVRVTAQDSTVRDYTVTITRRLSSDATLSDLTGTPCTDGSTCGGTLTLDQTFAPGLTAYTATVVNAITHARLTPTVNHSAATVQVGKGATLSMVNSGTASNAIALDVGANAVTVRVTAQDSTVRDYTVTIAREAMTDQPTTPIDWTATLNVKNAGVSNVGCRNGVSGAGCDSEDVLSDDEFTYTRNIYGEPSTWTFQIEELYRTSNGSRNELVLVANVSFINPDGTAVPNQPLLHTFRGFVLTVLDPRNGNITPVRLSFARAAIAINGDVARWTYDGTPWFPHPGFEDVSTTLTLGMERPAATLDTTEVYYDGITVDHPDGVDGFVNWVVATPASYGYGSWIPGEFPSIDPDKGVVQVTHAKLKVYPEHAGGTMRLGKVTYSETDQTNDQATPPVVCKHVTAFLKAYVPPSITIIVDRPYYRCVAFGDVASGDTTQAIALSADSPNTHVDIEVTDGDIVRTFLLNIDPPPRTYSLSPTARVTEGQDAALTLTLSEPAPAGGVEFTVSAGYGTAGSDDLGAIASPVTVPEGSSALEVAVPTVDDDRYEGDESFTVTVAATGPGWAADPEGTDTATVTIQDNEEAPDGPEPRAVRVVPGDGSLTVSWTVAPRDGVADGEIRHALRWSQTTGADHYWANPRDPRSVGPNDGITVEGGVTRYVITGLENDVATLVHLRSFTGDDRSERSSQSSRWVEEEGEHTTPRGGEQTTADRTYSVNAAASAAEGGGASLTITLSQAAPAEGVEFSVTADHSGGATATADDVGAVPSPVTVAQGNTTLDVTIPTVADAVDEDDETFTVTVAANTAGWEKAGDGRDTATVTIADDDTAGITVTAASPLTVAEDGTATYTVVLDSRPTADVTVTAASNDGGAATVSPASRTFTPSAWNTPLTFTVSGVADADTDDEQVTINHSVTSDDERYAVIPLSAVSVSVSDTTAEAPQGDQSPQAKYADLIAKVKEWRNDPCCVNHKPHTDRWDRVLLTFGETVADTTLTVMTAAEAQTYADRGWTRWIEVTKALRELENRAPTVASTIADAIIVSESGTRQVSLSGVFNDADNDPLNITAASSNQAVATALAASDGSTLTVSAQARGEAEITVTAEDAYGLTVEDTFTVTVKAAPVVASAIADVSGLEEGATQDVSLTGVFRDADGDPLIITAASSDETKATVTVAADQSKLTVAGVAEATATITVTARDSDDNRVSDAFEVSVTAPPPQETPNRAPTVSSAIADATIVSESGTRQVSLSGVFSDADNDSLTLTATSSDETKATVSVASDGSTLTVSAQARGEAEITVTAEDAYGLTVEDTFTVTVKAAPVVASAISDISGLEVDATQDVSLAGVFSDADGDTLTITAVSSDDAKATVTVASDGSKLTLTGVAAGTATITVTAQDSDGNRVSDAFEVAVVEVEAEATGDGPTPVLNLRCIAETDRVAFLWDAPEWSGGDLYAYDYRLTLPGGRSESGRLTGSTLLLRPGDYQQGTEASVSVKAVYELADGKEVSSAEATLTCRVGE